MVTRREWLEEDASRERVEIIEHTMPRALRAAYVRVKGQPAVIGISRRLSREEAACAIALGLGYHHTGCQNLLALPAREAGRQQRRAGRWAYRRMLPLDAIGHAYLTQDANPFAMAEALDVPRDFLDEAIAYYHSVHGAAYEGERYRYRFAPYFEVLPPSGGVKNPEGFSPEEGDGGVQA